MFRGTFPRFCRLTRVTLGFARLAENILWIPGTFGTPLGLTSVTENGKPAPELRRSSLEITMAKKSKKIEVTEAEVVATTEVAAPEAAPKKPIRAGKFLRRQDGERTLGRLPNDLPRGLCSRSSVHALELRVITQDGGTAQLQRHLLEMLARTHGQVEVRTRLVERLGH